MLKEFEKRLLSSLILIPISIFFIIQGSVFFIFFLSLIFLTTSYEWSKMTKKKDVFKIFGIIFIFFSLYTAFYIRENSGLVFFLFLVIVCIFTDIGGYVFGKTFKGPKLTRISPNKTYAGVIGSFLFSMVVGIIYIKYLDIEDISSDPLILLFLILFISSISQIGDLIVSYFKRKAKLKDTGKILPGHGGLLDRIDGLIFVVPIIYLLELF